MLPILPIWTLNWKPYSSTTYVKLFITIIYTIYHTYVYKKSKISFSYMLYAYSVKEPIGELNLKRALDEDTGVFSSFFSLLSSSSPLGQTAVSGNSTLHQ